MKARICDLAQPKPVVRISDALSPRERAGLRASDLCNRPLLPVMLAVDCPALERILEQEGLPHETCQGARESGRDGAGRFVVYSGRSPALEPGQCGLDLQSLPTDAQSALAALDDERAALHEWRLGPIQARERIALYDRRALRQTVVAALRQTIERAGGVWATLAPYPRGFQTAFNFRFDHDAYEPADFQQALDAARGSEPACTHFVCGSTHAGRKEVFARLAGLDVGSHGYWHHAYRDEEDNYRNVARGIEALQRGGLTPIGFAAPHGRFNCGLLAVLQRLDVPYSSEFALAYDDLPFTVSGNLLQIPIHPVCLGIALEGARRQALPPRVAVAETIRHFRRMLYAKHAAEEPLFFYGHPDGRIGRFPEVLRGLLSAVRELPGVWNVTMTEFSRWWKLRKNVKLSVCDDGAGRWQVTADILPSKPGAVLRFWQDDRLAHVPLVGRSTTIDLERTDWRPPPVPLASEACVSKRTGDWKGALREWLDWERETPVHELTGRTIRGRVKRLLRRARP